MYHCLGDFLDIVLISKRSGKSWSIKESGATIPSAIPNILPFINAFSGCHSTLEIFSLGKPAIFKWFKGVILIWSYSQVINRGWRLLVFGIFYDPFWNVFFTEVFKKEYLLHLFLWLLLCIFISFWVFLKLPLKKFIS